MNKYYDEFKQMIDAYLAKHGKQVEFESNLYETSLNDADSKNIYDNTRKDIDVISMDDIAHKPYREIRYPESVKEEDSISTNDAFVISEEKNPNDVFRIQKGIDYKCDKIEYVPLFLQKLQKYIYHDVFVYTPAMLERYFVNMLHF